MRLLLNKEKMILLLRTTAPKPKKRLSYKQWQTAALMRKKGLNYKPSQTLALMQKKPYNYRRWRTSTVLKNNYPTKIRKTTRACLMIWKRALRIFRAYLWMMWRCITILVSLLNCKRTLMRKGRIFILALDRWSICRMRLGMWCSRNKGGWSLLCRWRVGLRWMMIRDWRRRLMLWGLKL